VSDPTKPWTPTPAELRAEVERLTRERDEAQLTWHAANDRAMAAEAEVERLTGVVRDFVGSAPHWRIFLTTRERIHADGLKLFDEAVTNARNLLETAGMRETK